MEQVEEFCENIILINKGKVILEGKVNEIKQRFKKHEFSVHYIGELPSLPERFPVVSRFDHEVVMKLEHHTSGNDLLRELVNHNVQITAFSELLPSLNQIFIEQGAHSHHE